LSVNPFLDLRVIPSFGTFSARLVWRMQQGYEHGRFSIWRSDDGVNGWAQLGQVIDSENFVDPRLLTEGKAVERYYKVIFQGPTGRFDSPIVATFGLLTRREFGAARLILQKEWQDLRQRTPVKLFKLKASAPPCPRCTSGSSGLQVGVGLCNQCYGTTREGGYWRPPLDTFMRIMTISPQVRMDNPEGAGTSDPVKVKIRTLAFPALNRDDLVVNHQADRRYLVETVELSYFNGKAPCVAEAELTLLRRNDVRYQLPLT
jgi:hypothetical protein